jgi:hypothetical protein
MEPKISQTGENAKDRICYHDGGTTQQTNGLNRQGGQDHHDHRTISKLGDLGVLGGCIASSW